MTLGNASTTTSSGYNTQGALASLTHNLAGTAQDLTHTDSRNQAQEITGDSWSNDLYQFSGHANGTKSYTSNGRNQYTAAAGAALTYDASGNLAGDGTWSYGYDTDNRLKSASKSGLSATLAYDMEGRLRQSVIGGATTNLLYDGVSLIAEYDSAGNLLRRYVHGPGTDEALVWYEGSATTNKTWLYADHLGSVVAAALPSPELKPEDLKRRGQCGRSPEACRAPVPSARSAQCRPERTPIRQSFRNERAESSERERTATECGRRCASAPHFAGTRSPR